MNMCVR
ncbi:unnamed protein product, partial [Didymodactylos carnosus]